MIVVDASALANALTEDGNAGDTARTALAKDEHWAAPDHLNAYDAAYVATAEVLGCPLVTADAKLANATGPRCEIVLLKE